MAAIHGGRGSFGWALALEGVPAAIFGCSIAIASASIMGVSTIAPQPATAAVVAAFASCVVLRRLAAAGRRFPMPAFDESWLEPPAVTGPDTHLAGPARSGPMPAENKPGRPLETPTHERASAVRNAGRELNEALAALRRSLR